MQIATIRKGQHGQFGPCAAIGVQGPRASTFKRGDVKFLDIAEMRDVALGRRHIFSDAAAHADDFDGFIFALWPKHPGRTIALPCTIAEIGVQIGMANMAADSFDRTKINTELIWRAREPQEMP